MAKLEDCDPTTVTLADDRTCEGASDENTVAAALRPGPVDSPKDRLARAAIHAALFGPGESELSATVLGDYQIEAHLGTGGMGEVYVARHRRGGPRVALKTMQQPAALNLYRFKREFRALADIQHPNLIRLHQLDAAEDRLFFTMELLEGAQPFVTWVRQGADAGAKPDLARLAHAMCQLVDGVAALHRHDHVHRDLKPANVLVTPEARVVVLDFGLVSDLAEPNRGVTRDGQLLGTPSHMAPEQALGEPAGPAADIYSIGVMLFECLTGRLPHEGPALRQLVDKQSEARPDPGELVDGLPPALRELCSSMLARRAQARPSAVAVRAQLSELAPAKPAVEVPTEPPFVGREREFLQLDEAVRELEDRRDLVVVHLSGPSGYGKSRLSQQLRRQLHAREAIVLHGRCRKQETLPYKGLDPVVDAMSSYLRRLPAPARAEFEPRDVDALVRLFPVLDDIWAPKIARNIAPPEIRKLGGHALAELFVRVGERGTLVVQIDDFQWADLDTVELLERITGFDPPPALMLMLSYRSAETSSEAVTALLASNQLSGPQARTIELGPLDHANARELASALLSTGAEARGLADAGALELRADAIAMQAGGSPLFVARLARASTTPDSDANLDEVIGRELAVLAAPQARVLDLLAAFGGPLPVDLLAALSELGQALEPALDQLAEVGLLARIEGVEGVEVAHDRVREQVMARLEPRARAELHWCVGEGLLRHLGETPKGADLRVIANHFDAALTLERELTDVQRLELAALEHRAGLDCLELGAWSPARRLLRRAELLLAPWMTAAQASEESARLCLEVRFALTRAEAHLDEQRGRARFEELIHMPLAATDYARFVHWFEEWERISRAQWDAPSSVPYAIQGLRRLGVRTPARVSWPQALASYRLGWRALRSSGRLRAHELVFVADPRTRAIMTLTAILAQAQLLSNPRHNLWALGRYCRLLARHGAHESVGTVMLMGSFAALLLGRAAEARAMIEVVERSMADPGTSISAVHMQKAVAPVALSVLRPIAQIRPLLLARHAEIRRGAPQLLVETSASACITGLQGTVTMREALELMDGVRTSEGSWENESMAGMYAATSDLARVLGEGGRLGPELDYSNISKIQADVIRVNCVRLSVLFADFEHARANLAEFPRNFARRLGVSWHVCELAMLKAIVDGEAGLPRRTLARRLRPLTKIARRWAEYCPENFGPMLTMIEAEAARAAGRLHDASDRYERVRADASASGYVWLGGLASHRLARVALARDNLLLAKAGFEAAREAYTAWLAPALERAVASEQARALGEP